MEKFLCPAREDMIIRTLIHNQVDPLYWVGESGFVVHPTDGVPRWGVRMTLSSGGYVSSPGEMEDDV